MGRMNQGNKSRSKNVTSWEILEDSIYFTTITLKKTILLKLLTLDIFIQLSSVLSNDILCACLFSSLLVLKRFINPYKKYPFST